MRADLDPFAVFGRCLSRVCGQLPSANLPKLTQSSLSCLLPTSTTSSRPRIDERNSQSSSITIILSPISSFLFSPFPCKLSTSSTPLFNPSFAPLTCDNSHHNGEAQSNKRRQDLRSVPVLSVSPLTRLTRIYSQPSMTHTRSSR